MSAGRSRRKFLWPLLLLLVASLSLAQIIGYHRAYAGSAAAAQHAGGEDAGHGEHRAPGRHHAPPLVYYLYWVLLLAAVVRSLQFLNAHQKQLEAHQRERAPEEEGDAAASHEEDHGHHHPQPTGLDKFLVACVVLMFVFEQFPSLAHFHEANSVGLIKFLLKTGLGVSLMTYGILGMGEH